MDEERHHKGEYADEERHHKSEDNIRDCAAREKPDKFDFFLFPKDKATFQIEGDSCL